MTEPRNTMPTELTKEKLGEIRERADIAPLGPWVTDTLYRHSRTEVCLALLDAGGIRLADTLNADEQTINEDVDEDSISFYVSGACADALEFAAKARTDIPTLLDHIAALTDSVELSKRLQSAKLPCGHLACYGFTEDGGAHIVCLVCERAALTEERDRMREALVKAEADMVTADATANGRWSEWGDRATWVADKLDEAIEGVRAALAPAPSDLVG